MLELGIGAAGGGLFGMIGGLVRQFLDYRDKKDAQAHDLDVLKATQAHELALRDKDKELLVAESESQFKLAEVQIDGAVETARLGAVAASYAGDKANFATGESAKNSPWFIAVDFLRGVIRPGITLLFDLALLAIWICLIVLLWPELARLFAAKDPSIVQPLWSLLNEITKSIIFLATTATGYWFVARPGGGVQR